MKLSTKLLLPVPVYVLCNQKSILCWLFKKRWTK